MRAVEKEGCVMDVLEENEIPKLMKLGCQTVFDCTQQLKCYGLHGCKLLVSCVLLDTCGRLLSHLDETLITCGGQFYNHCPGFGHGPPCDFLPYNDWGKWKEKVNAEKIFQLETKVKELEVALKKKG
jgi:hypothetical protein